MEEIRRLVQRVNALEKEQRALATASQMAQTSIEAGPMTWRQPSDVATEPITVASVDAAGNASFQNISVADATIGGQSVADMFATNPLGTVAYGSWTAQSTSTTDTIPWYSVDFTATEGRLYRIAAFATLVSAVANDNVYMEIWDDTTGTELTRAAIVQVVANRNDHTVEGLYAGTFTPGVHTLTVKVTLENGTGPCYGYASGVRPATLLIDDMGVAFPNGAYDANPGGGGGPPPPSPKPQRYTKTYAATASRSFRGDGSLRNSNGSMYQGHASGDSFNGDQRSWAWFDWKQIWSDLNGASIVKAELYLYFDHWWYGSGGTAVLGFIDATTVLNTYDADHDNVNEVSSPNWPNPGSRWVNLTGTTIAQYFANGTATGIALGPAPSSSLTYYGYCRGAGQTGPPQLRFTYDK